MESQHRSVKVIEIFRVPPSPTRPESESASPESLPLTFFDILWLRFPPVTRLFFYESSETESFYDSIILKLKNSLSLSLSYYLPLAGHLSWPENCPKPVIEYFDGDGVSFTVAVSDSPEMFKSLSGDKSTLPTVEIHPLTPKLASSRERAEAIAIQVTLFPGSGFCIGIASHHAVMDGKTSTSFVKSWARISRSSSFLECQNDRPFYDRTSIADPAGLESIYANAWMNEDGEPENRSLNTWEFIVNRSSIRATFELSREKIEKLKNCAPAQLRVTSYSIVSGYVSVCVAKAMKVTGSPAKMAYLTLLADFRSRLIPAVPPKYFGNCVGGRGAAVEIAELSGEDGMRVALEAIGRAVESLDENKDLFKGAENLVSVMIAGKAKLGNDVAREDSVRVISFVGSPRFGLYGVDFGFGRPRKVDMASLDKTGAICLSDGKNCDGSVEIGLVMKPDEMDAFAFEFFKGLENI